MPLARLQQVHIVEMWGQFRVIWFGSTASRTASSRLNGSERDSQWRSLARWSNLTGRGGGALATELMSVGDLELTPILESVSLAARKFDQATLSQGPLGASLARIWACYVENRSTGDIGNRPGIMGRLAELFGRAGADFDSLSLPSTTTLSECRSSINFLEGLSTSPRSRAESDGT